MPTAQEQLAIQAIVTARDIPYLVHFTRAENLPSILQYGLQPRSVMDDAENNKNNLLFGIDCFVNDNIRVDYKREYNCLSISFPNVSMFWRCRQRSRGKWIILLLNPSILWEKECLFYPTNAASSSVSTLPINEFRNASALENMFGGRRDANMHDHDPTDVQAEVMVEGIIELHYIGYCLFQNKVSTKLYQKQFPTMNMVHLPSMYSNRKHARFKLGFIG